MIWISVLVLAVAVSFDSLAMGITYGMNRITIPWKSRIVLSIVSGCSVLAAMSLGWLLEQRISSNTAAVIGGLIFIFLGFHTLWRSYRPTEQKMLLHWRIPLLGLIIQVCQEPLKADSDKSQTINGSEAFILGGALALDAIGAGFGAAMLGLPLFPTTLAVMIASVVFITQGLKTGAALVSSPNLRQDLRWLPGAIILVMGFLKLISQ